MQDVQRISSIQTNTSGGSSDHIEYPRMNTPAALILLVAITALTYLTAENLVESVNGLVEHSSVNKEWITLIVIPIISNAAEHTTAVVVASKGKFDLAMSVAVGSCIQISLFVIPVLVIVAWGLGKPLTLFFDPLETLVCSLFACSNRINSHVFPPLVFVLICTYSQVCYRRWKNPLDEWNCSRRYVTSPPHWIVVTHRLSPHVAVYIIIAICFWYYPEPSNQVTGLVCI